MQNPEKSFSFRNTSELRFHLLLNKTKKHMCKFNLVLGVPSPLWALSGGGGRTPVQNQRSCCALPRGSRAWLSRVAKLQG